MSEYLDRKQVIELYEKHHPHLATYVWEFGQELRQLPIVEERPHAEWIPVTFRKMTEQEVKEMEEEFGMTLQEDEKVMLNCHMPENDQKILVCTKWGHIYIDTCEYDPDYGYGLESNGDWDGITAWMPLPEPYKKEGEAE